MCFLFIQRQRIKFVFAYNITLVVFAIPFKVLFRAVPEAECFFDLFVALNGVSTVLYCVFDRVVRAA